MTRPTYLFLIGVGRSGTTVLRKSLGLHPGIYYTGTENRIVTDFLRVQFETFTDPDRVSKLLVTREQFDRVMERALNDLLWLDEERRARSIRTAAFAMPPELPPYLLRVFPNARILHLVRNGIQVISSRQLHEGFQHMPFEEQCTRWARAYDLYKWGLTQEHAYHLFRYEWFNDEPRLRAELSRVYEWLEIPPDDAPIQNMLNTRYHPTYHPNEATRLNIYDAQTSQQGRAQIDQIRTERWHFWTDEQRAQFEQICGDAMRGFGYPIPWRDPNPAVQPQANRLSERVRSAIDKTLNINTIHNR